MLLGRVDREALHGLVALAFDLLLQHARLPDRQLEALAAHHLDQHGQLQLAAPLHLPCVRAIRLAHTQRNVADQLGLQARVDLTCGELLPLQPGQRRGVDADRDRHRRLIDPDHLQRARIVGVGQRLADRDLGHAGHRNDLARPRLAGLHALERLGHVQLGRERALDAPIGAAPCELLALADVAVAHAADRQPPDVGRGVQVRDQRLQRLIGIVRGRGDALQEQLEQRREIALD